jgi:uncharacterized protein (UPF0332 family)
MTPKFNTRDVNKSLYANYLKRAEECLYAARDSFEAEKWNASAINAIHSCIAACDAMCVYFLGKRHSGDSHNDAIRLLKTIRENDEGINTNANRASRILGIKNMAEYEERLIYRSEAEKILKDCERFVEFAKKRLPSL